MYISATHNQFGEVKGLPEDLGVFGLSVVSAGGPLQGLPL